MKIMRKNIVDKERELRRSNVKDIHGDTTPDFKDSSLTSGVLDKNENSFRNSSNKIGIR